MAGWRVRNDVPLPAPTPAAMSRARTAGAPVPVDAGQVGDHGQVDPVEVARLGHGHVEERLQVGRADAGQEGGHVVGQGVGAEALVEDAAEEGVVAHPLAGVDGVEQVLAPLVGRVGLQRPQRPVGGPHLGQPVGVGRRQLDELGPHPERRPQADELLPRRLRAAALGLELGLPVGAAPDQDPVDVLAHLGQGGDGALQVGRDLLGVVADQHPRALGQGRHRVAVEAGAGVAEQHLGAGPDQVDRDLADGGGLALAPSPDEQHHGRLDGLLEGRHRRRHRLPAQDLGLRRLGDAPVGGAAVVVADEVVGPQRLAGGRQQLRGDFGPTLQHLLLTILPRRLHPAGATLRPVLLVAGGRTGASGG